MLLRQPCVTLGATSKHPRSDFEAPVITRFVPIVS